MSSILEMVVVEQDNHIPYSSVEVGVVFRKVVGTSVFIKGDTDRSLCIKRGNYDLGDIVCFQGNEQVILASSAKIQVTF